MYKGKKKWVFVCILNFSLPPSRQSRATSQLPFRSVLLSLRLEIATGNPHPRQREVFLWSVFNAATLIFLYLLIKLTVKSSFILFYIPIYLQLCNPDNCINRQLFEYWLVYCVLSGQANFGWHWSCWLIYMWKCLCFLRFYKMVHT